MNSKFILSDLYLLITGFPIVSAQNTNEKQETLQKKMESQALQPQLISNHMVRSLKF